MKLKKLALSIIVSLLVANLICFPAQASGGSEATVEITVTVLPPEQPPPGAPAPVTTPVTTTGLTTTEPIRVDSEGFVQMSTRVTTEDNKLTLDIPKNTKMLDKEGKPLENLSSVIEPTPPEPPEDSHIIGLAYNFGPNGATFDPPLELTWSYDPADLPEGVNEEDLVVAFYDEEAGEWIELECEVDTENNIITAKVPHFSKFAVIAKITRKPAIEEEEKPVVEEEEVPVVEEEEIPVVEEEEKPVVEEEEKPVVEKEEEVVPKKVNWALIAGIIVGVVVIGLLGYYLWIRRRRQARTL